MAELNYALKEKTNGLLFTYYSMRLHGSLEQSPCHMTII